MSRLATPVPPVTPQRSPSVRALRPPPPTGGPSGERWQIKRSEPSPGGSQRYGPCFIFCADFTASLYLNSNSSTPFKRKENSHSKLDFFSCICFLFSIYCLQKSLKKTTMKLFFTTIWKRSVKLDGRRLWLHFVECQKWMCPHFYVQAVCVFRHRKLLVYCLLVLIN